MKRYAVMLLAAVLLMGFTGNVFAESAEMLKIAIPGRDGDVIDYSMAIMQLGAQPVVIWDEYDPADFDGLLLPGGLDIDPSRYGQADIACGLIDAELDEIQFQAADRFIQAGIPVLGICRGHQLLNVYFGGTLVQHLATADAHMKLDNQDNVHATSADEEGFLASIYGTEFAVNSAHHQAVDQLAEGMRAVQWAEDGTIEAMQHQSLPVYSVQWHPERMCFDYQRADTVDGGKLLAYFLEICAEYKE